MIKYYYVLLLGLVGCASSPSSEPEISKVDRSIANYESSCVGFLDSMIESKTYTTPQQKQNLIDVTYKHYNFAKDNSNPESTREDAIKIALSMCQIQKEVIGKK